MKKTDFRKIFFYFSAFLVSFLIPMSTRAVETCTVQNLDCLAPKSPTFWIITSSAFVDSVNPCAIAVLLFVLSALIFFNDKKKLLRVGLAFILGLYLTYFVFGLGLFYVLKINTWINPDIFHWIMGIFAIIIGLLNIKDYFWYGGCGIVMEIPRKWRPNMTLILARATSVPVAFATGVLVTAFELPCTGGPYVFVLGVLSQNISRFLITPILAYYNLIFILPLLVILGGVYLGYMRVDKTEHWKERNIKKLHLIAGVILVLLGLWVLPFGFYDQIIPFLLSLAKSFFLISSRLSHFFFPLATPISSLISPFFR